MWESKEQRDRQIFDYLGQSLPNEIKYKLSGSDTKQIVQVIGDFIDSHSRGLEPAQKKRDKDSKFDSGEGPEFLKDLSKL